MDLFDKAFGKPHNLLPCDGEVLYYGAVLSSADADCHFKQLMEVINWQHDEAVVLGRRIVTKRKVAWYGDKPFNYTYSKTTKQALPWITPLDALKTRVEEEVGEPFNSCLLNLYHSGEEGVSWHSDDETELKNKGTIASLSLGAERKFVFKHKRTGEKRFVLLEHGSLLLMKGETQRHWLHELPKTKKVSQPRVNLTFRQMQGVNL